MTKLIGEGGMGRVWRAWKVSEGGFKKLVAIKTSKSSQYIDLFMNEAKISARFDHENIVKTFDFGKTDEEFFLVMEYIRGINLKELSEQVEDVPLDIFFYVIDKILSAVSYIHSFEGRGLVHRDINMKNILISWNGNVKLSDFGITLPQYGDFDPFGKIGYVPPEVILGKGWSQSGDIWCVGVLMWELLTGKKLFSGRNKNEIKRKILSSDIPPPSKINESVPQELDEIIMKALSRLPETRYLSAEFLQKDLRDTALSLKIQLYQEDFSSFLHRYFLQKMNEEEKEIAEEEVRVSSFVSSENTKTEKEETRKKENAEQKIKDYYLYVRREKKKSVRKRKKNKNSFMFLSSVFGFIIGLSLGMLKGSYDIRKAEEFFRKGIILMKGNNLHQATKMFEVSADMSDVKELKMIVEKMREKNETVNENEYR